MSLFSGVAAFLREAPIELYRFELGGETYRYAATSGEPYVYKGDVYAPEYLLRGGLHFSNDFAKDVLTITLPATNAVAALFFSGTPEYAMRLKAAGCPVHAAMRPVEGMRAIDLVVSDQPAALHARRQRLAA